MPSPHEFHAPQPSYSKSDLLASGRGGYFGPGNAQLPSPPMLMMDRIVEISMEGGETAMATSRPSWTSRATFGSSNATL